jgi:hypothetical protein
MKYFFSLYVFFLSIYGNLYANANQSQDTLTFQETINQIENIDSDIHQNGTILTTTFFHTILQKANDLICTTDVEIVEEENESPSKKNNVCSAYYKFDFRNQKLESQHKIVKKRFSHYKFFEYYTTTKLNVLLGVYLI